MWGLRSRVQCDLIRCVHPRYKTRSNTIVHYAEDDRSGYHLLASFEITNAKMDMDTLWLVCETRHGVSMIDKVITAKFSRVCCDKSSQCPNILCQTSICPAYYHPVAFRGRCAQVLQIHGNGKLYDPHFQETKLPISIHPSMYIWLLRQNWVSDNNFMLADKSTCEKLLFWDEVIAFLGHTRWTTKCSGSDQRGTAKDTRSQVLEAVNNSGSSLRTRGSWYTSNVHTVLTSKVYVFCFV